MLPVGKGYRKYASMVELRALVRSVEERVFVYMADKKHNVEIVKKQEFRAQVHKYVSMIKGGAFVKYAGDHKYVSMIKGGAFVKYAGDHKYMHMAIARGCGVKNLRTPVLSCVLKFNQ